MKKAIQQFMLGSVTNNEKQVTQTLAAMKTAGYSGIELCDFMIHPTPFVVKLLTTAAGMPVGNGGKLDWPKLIQESGLGVPAIHSYLDSVEKNLDAAVSQCEGFQTNRIVITGMYRFDYTRKEEPEGTVTWSPVTGFAKKFSVDGVYFTDGLQSTGTAGLFKFTRVADDGTEIFSADVRIWLNDGGLAADAAQTSGNCPLYVPDTADNLSLKMVAIEETESGKIKLQKNNGQHLKLTEIIKSVMVEIVWGADGENQRSFRVDVYNPNPNFEI